MIVYEKENRRVVCSFCGEILLLQTEQGEFYHPHSCQHYIVRECFDICDDGDPEHRCPLADVAEIYPSADGVFCIIPRQYLKR